MKLRWKTEKRVVPPDPKNAHRRQPLRILAVDTATASCAVAAVEGKDLRAEIFLAGGQTHSRHLMDLVALVLHRAGWTIADVDGFAATCGPGSFTGLRIGLATIKGLALAREKPVTGVSTLDALAMPCGASGMSVYALLDARRDEVYWARYRDVGGALQREGRAAVAPLETVLALVTEPACFVGNAALRRQKEIVGRLGRRARIAPAALHTVRGYAVALLANGQFEGGRGVDAGRLRPDYVRQADAQLNFRPGAFPGH